MRVFVFYGLRVCGQKYIIYDHLRKICTTVEEAQ